MSLLGAGVAFTLMIAAQAGAVPRTTPDENGLSAVPLAHIDNAYHLIGFGNVKPHCRGTLDISGGGFAFSSPDASGYLPTSVIVRFNVDQDSRALLPGVAGRIALLAPFGSGFAVGMIRTGVDVLTLGYRDQMHGLHEAVFLLPKNEAQSLTSVLQSRHIEQENTPSQPNQSFAKDSDLTGHQVQKLSKGSVAIQLGELQVEQAGLPPCFRAALYEELIARLESARYFQKVLRAGEAFQGAPSHLITLHVTVRAFTRGNPRAREITGAVGRSRMTAEVQIMDTSNTVLRDSLLNSVAVGNMEDFDTCKYLAIRTVKLIARGR